MSDCWSNTFRKLFSSVVCKLSSRGKQNWPCPDLPVAVGGSMLLRAGGGGMVIRRNARNKKNKKHRKMKKNEKSKKSKENKKRRRRS